MSLKEIARRAGVSPSTVSRVLNNNSHKCASPETKNIIWSIARELNYVPNQNARELKLKHNSSCYAYHVSIVSARFHDLSTDPFFQELFRSIEEELLQQNCILSGIYNANDLINLNCDIPKENGIILLGRCPNGLLSTLTAQYKSIIGIGRNPTNYAIDEVICDGLVAAKEAMNYLIKIGHKKIAYVGDCSYETRYLGYHQALINNQIPFNYDYIFPTNQTKEEGYQAMKKILSMKDRPNAIFCANDITAIGLLNAYHESLIKNYIPSVISIDNIEEAQTTVPLLTTVDIPKGDMGRLAVTILLHRMERKHTEHIRVSLPCRLIIRESC